MPERPPIMSAPNRNRVEMREPGIPVSLKRHAEQLVIERAREFVRAGTVGQESTKLCEAVRVLDVLEGKRES